MIDPGGEAKEGARQAAARRGRRLPEGGPPSTCTKRKLIR